MPYKLSKRGQQICVIDSATGTAVECHGTRRDALQHLRALYANVAEASYKDYSARAGQVIRGNLARGGDGKFTAAGNASAVKKKPIRPSFGSKRIDVPPSPKVRKARAAAKKKTTGKSKAGAGAKPKTAAQQELESIRLETARGRLADQQQNRADRQRQQAERIADRAKREIASANREAQRASDRTKRDQDRQSRVAERRRALADRKAEQAQRKAEAEAKKKAGGGGGGKGKATKPDKAAQRASNRTKVESASGIEPAAFGTLMNMADGAEAGDPAALEALRRAGLTERDITGAYRISEAGRAFVNAANSGDTGRARDAASRARDRFAKRKDRATKVRSRRGGGVRLKQAEIDHILAVALKAMRPPDRQLDAGHTGVVVMFAIPASAADAVAALDGVTEPADQLHITMCYLGDGSESPLADNKGRILDAIEEWAIRQRPLAGIINGMGRFFTEESDNTNAVYISPDLPGLPALRQSLIETIHQTGIEYSQDHGYTPHVTVAYVPEAEPTPDIRPNDIPLELGAVTLAWGDEQYDIALGGDSEKSYSPIAVYKQANGDLRWILISSTAFKDRSGETVSTEALTEDCDYADRVGKYGPLRLWHIPGLDIGDCDFNMVRGRCLIESGTFRYKSIGEAIAADPEAWQASIAFLHPLDQPCENGIFTRVRRFERSLLPAGHACNPFTRLMVSAKEAPMPTLQEKITQLRAKLGAGGEALIDRMLDMAEATEKEADDLGVTFKEDDMAGGDGDPEIDPEDEADDLADDIILTAAEIDAISESVLAKVKGWLEPLLAGASTAKEAPVSTPAAVPPVTPAQPAAPPPNFAAMLEEFKTEMNGRIKSIEDADIPSAAQGYRPSKGNDNIKKKEAAADGPALDQNMESAVDFILNGNGGQPTN